MKKALLYLVYFLSPLPIILILYLSDTFKYTDYTILIPMLLGACAYTWLNAEFVISARPKYIERYFGLDKFYRFHAIMAIISLIIVFAHKLIQDYFMGHMPATEIGEKAFYLFVILAVLAIIFMVDTFVRILPPLGYIKRVFKNWGIGKFELQKILHNLNIAAGILLFLHVMQTTSAKIHGAVRGIYIAYFAIAVGYYLYHKLFKLLLPGKNKYEVTEVVSETDNVFTLKLRPINGRLIDYKPGQFIFLRLFGKGISSEEHPFSISSSSSEGFLSVTIKELGDYTGKIRNVKVGTRAIIDGAFGTFSYLNVEKNKSLIFIAGGVGITPMLSMLRHLRVFDKERKVYLFWGINSRSELFNQKEFDQMSSEMKNFRFTPVYFRDDEADGEKGVIDAEKINRLAQDSKDNGVYYICGPAAMTKNVLRELQNMGIPKKQIKFESFSL